MNPTSAATSAQGLHAAGGRKPRVAVVEDNPVDALVTALLVEQFGGAPLTAIGGKAALVLLRQADDVDLVLIDLAVAGMDGIVAALDRRVSADDRRMPIVPLYAGRDAPAAPGGGHPFADALIKPYSPRQLYAAMTSALDGNRPAPGATAS